MSLDSKIDVQEPSPWRWEWKNIIRIPPDTQQQLAIHEGEVGCLRFGMTIRNLLPW